MRLWCAGFIVLLAVSAEARAGLYNTAEPDEALLDPTYLEQFHAHLLFLRSLGMDKVEFDNPLRRRYVLMAELAQRGPTASLTPEQTLNLSTVLIRRRRIDDALNLLRPLALAQRDNYLLQSNLATAYFLSGQKQRAIDTLEQALSSWPKRWDDLTPEQQKAFYQLGWEENIFHNFRKYEESLLRLFKLRAREPDLKTTHSEKLDDLFGVRYVGASGEFEAGALLAAAERKKLPPNAIDIVQQLVNWLPYDDRLYWQLGELMNAQGPNHLKAARVIFDELIDKRSYRAEEAREHRRKIFEAPLPAEATGNLLDDGKKGDTLKPVDDPPLTWQPLLISFAAGALVAVFGMWQIRELRRRRQRSAS